MHRIPFLASDVGGTRELVSEQYHDRVLIEPHPESLSEALLEVLRNGGTVAEGAFDYLENLSAWRDFHRFLAGTLMEKKVDEVVADLGAAFRNEDPTPPGACEGGTHTESLLSNVSSNLSPPKSRVSVCIYHHSRPDYLESLLNSLQPQSSEIDEIVIVNDGLGEDVSGEIRQHMAERFASFDWKVVEQPHRCVGPALNAAAGQSEADMLVFLNTERHICKPYPHRNSAPRGERLAGRGVYLLPLRHRGSRPPPPRRGSRTCAPPWRRSGHRLLSGWCIRRLVLRGAP